MISTSITRSIDGVAIYARSYTLGNNSISNCYFKNNTATKSTSTVFTNITNLNPVEDSEMVTKYCVFENNIGNLGGCRGLDYNYYADGSNKTNLLLLINNNDENSLINQKNSDVEVKLVLNKLYSYEDLKDIIGINYELNITSSSDLINTTGMKLSPDNNYKVNIDISKLPANHENITLFANGFKISEIFWDYTNVQLNNITTKAGNTIDLVATFKTSDNKEIPNGKVAFKINDKTIGHSKIANGVAKLTYTIPDNFTVKDYKISVVYGGNDKFIQAREDATLSLLKSATKTTISNKIEDNKIQINIKTNNEADKSVVRGKLTVKINDKTYQRINTTGDVTVNYTIDEKLYGKDVKITAIYSENTNYMASIDEVVEKIPAKTPKTSKMPKTDVTINNYYVDADTGSDTNDGSQSSPFKTIAKAISMVNMTKTPSNIYLKGVFKGMGNTNLTIPGDLTITFIGLEDAAIDGEVNYTIKEKLDLDEYYWGSSRIWWPYLNGTGNWAMNITRGNGLIKLENLTIRNCWSPGRSSINLYNTSTVDNYGNLEVNNVSFIYNHGGVGAGIRNNNGATVVVNNSIFDSNRKSSSTGNYGAGIYNNGTATIINSVFKNNYARWGTVTNDKNMTIINSTIRDNIGYDGGSTYKTGSGITINTASTNFYEGGNVENVTTVIDGCTFTNNDQLDIYADKSNNIIKNNLFNKSKGIVIPQPSSTTGNNYNFTITNNTFLSPIGSSLYNALSSKDNITFTIRAYAPYNYIIENNTVTDLKGTNSKALEVKSNNAIIRNNTFDRIIEVSGNNNTITNNNITTTQDIYAISISRTSKNNTITNNNLQTKTYTGNAAINATFTLNTVENNTPVTKSIKIDDETFNKYFNNDGTLRPIFNEVQQIEIAGPLNNRNITVDREIKITQTNKNISTNITITVTNTGKLTINSVIIENTNQQPVIIINSENNTIENSNLKTDNNYTIVLNSKNNTITKNQLLADVLVGDNSVKAIEENNITSNTPTYTNYVISEDTYSLYFNNDGTMKPIETTGDIHFLIKDIISNKNFILNNNKTITITNYKNSQLINTTITTVDSTKLNLTNITITNNNSKPAVIINSDEANITYNNITVQNNAIEITNISKLIIVGNNIKSNYNKNTTTILIKDSQFTNATIKENNITTQNTPEITGNDIKVVSIGMYNTTPINMTYNNITTKLDTTANISDKIYAIELINPEIKTINSRRSSSTSYNNIEVVAKNYACALNIKNNTATEFNSNNITLSAKNTAAIIINSSKQLNLSSNNIKSENSGSSNMVEIQDSENIIIWTIRTTITNNNTTVIYINNSKNLTLMNNNINLNSMDSSAIKLINTNTVLVNNSFIITKNTNKSPIILNNTTKTTLTNNRIITTSPYTITIDEQSQQNRAENNTLYADERLGDESIEKLNNNVMIRHNNPVVKSYLYLNEKTYTQFFDENGNLRSEIPENITIQLTGNLEDKILNITKPINIISEQITLINSTLIIDQQAKSSNITGIRFEGEKTKIIIKADNCNIEIPNISIVNTESLNLTPFTVEGNNNNIIIDSYTATSNKELNSNITLLKIEGNNNTILGEPTKSIASYYTISNFNDVIGILFNNADKNILRYESITISNSNNANGIYLNNSKQNLIQTNLNGGTLKINNALKAELLKLSNSSNNTITVSLTSNQVENSTSILVENNSNFNNFIKISDYSNVLTTPIIIDNSNNNIITASIFKYQQLEGFAIELNEAVGNRIENNTILTKNLDGDKCILQENINDTVNNFVQNNKDIEGYLYLALVFSNTINTAKLSDIINISVNVANPSSGSNITAGNVIFNVNGVNVGVVEVADATASINYKITGLEGDKLYVTVYIYDPNFTYRIAASSMTIDIEKLGCKVLLPDVINNGITSTITSIVVGEDGNIVEDGNVTFKLNGEVIGIKAIRNGVAQLVFDSSCYSLKNYTIEAVYNGCSVYNSQNASATLSLMKYDVDFEVEDVVVNNGNMATLRAYVYDSYGHALNTGRVVFKLNGKTLKDTDNTTLYADVIGGVAEVKYMIPANMQPKDYTLTAVTESDKYNKATENATLKVMKTTPKIVVSPLNVKRSQNTTITIKLVDDNENNIVGNTNIAVKLNGKTVIKPMKITDGIAQITLNLTEYKNSNYNITVVAGANKLYESCSMTDVLTIEG